MRVICSRLFSSRWDPAAYPGPRVHVRHDRLHGGRPHLCHHRRKHRHDINKILIIENFSQTKIVLLHTSVILKGRNFNYKDYYRKYFYKDYRIINSWLCLQGSMITNMNQSKAEIRNKMDAIKQYMNFRKVESIRHYTSWTPSNNTRTLER